MSWILAFVLVLGCLALSSQPAEANDLSFTISDNNSSAIIEPETGAGMYDWSVDGYHHMEQQWFWYRVGREGPEANISTLPLINYGLSDTNFDGNNETLFLRYATSEFKIELTLLITGGTPGSGASDIAEVIRIVSLTGEPLDFHFYQYCDLNLMGTVEDDTVAIANGNSATQTDGPAAVSETVETPPASHFEAGYFANTLNSLNDAVATTLSDTAGPVGPGDLTWAFEWDFTLNPGGSYLISKDKHVTPEPAALSLLAGGTVVLTLRRRKK